MISIAEKDGVLRYLKNRYWNLNCKCRQKYKYFDNFGELKFVELPVSVLKNSNGISQYRQAKILDELVQDNKIILKLGKGRKRYYTILQKISEVME